MSKTITEVINILSQMREDIFYEEVMYNKNTINTSQYLNYIKLKEELECLDNTISCWQILKKI